MTEVEAAVQRLAAYAAAKKILTAAEAADKDYLLAQKRRRTEYAIDDNGDEIATVSVKWLNADAQDSVRIDDESVVLPWLLEQFGDKTVETVTRVTEQGRASAVDFALREFQKSGELLPGMTVVPAAEKKLSVSVTPVKDIVDRVQGMVNRGVLSVADVLALEPAKPGEPA